MSIIGVANEPSLSVSNNATLEFIDFSTVRFSRQVDFEILFFLEQ